MITSVAANYFCKNKHKKIKMQLRGKMKNERMLSVIWTASALDVVHPEGKGKGKGKGKATGDNNCHN